MTFAWQNFNCILKIIMVIPENDLITGVRYDKSGIQQLYQHLIEYIAEQHIKAIDYFKKSLPTKALKGRRQWPFYLWITPVLHDNFHDIVKRIKMTKAIEEAARTQPRMTALKPVQQWDPKEAGSYSRLDKAMTTSGLKSYWTAVDNAVSYFDARIIPNIIEEKNKNQFKYRRSGGEQHNSRRDDRRLGETSGIRRKLPPPPPYR